MNADASIKTRDIHYPIRTVSKLTGLSLDLLRAWERRYGVVSPDRSQGGRRYSDGDVRRLTKLRQAVERGYPISQVAQLQADELDAVLLDLADHGDQAGRRVAPLESTSLEGIIDAVERFDALDLDRRVGRLAALLPPRAFVHDVTLPLMHETGERWHDGRFSVAQEHLVSAVLRNVLGSLVRLHAVEQPSARLLFSTPAGDLHEFGILAAAMLASGGGLGVTYLGPNLPAHEIVHAARRSRADAVVLGVCGVDPDGPAVEEIGQVASALVGSGEIWVGGKALDALNVFPNVRALGDFAALEEALRQRGALI